MENEKADAIDLLELSRIVSEQNKVTQQLAGAVQIVSRVVSETALTGILDLWKAVGVIVFVLIFEMVMIVYLLWR